MDVNFVNVNVLEQIKEEVEDEEGQCDSVSVAGSHNSSSKEDPNCTKLSRDCWDISPIMEEDGENIENKCAGAGTLQPCSSKDIVHCSSPILASSPTLGKTQGEASVSEIDKDFARDLRRALDKITEQPAAEEEYVDIVN